MITACANARALPRSSPEVVLGAARRVQPVGSLGAGVDDHDHERGAPARTPHQRLRRGDIEQVRVVAVRGEAHEPHAQPADAQQRALAREPGVRDVRTPQRGERLAAPGLPEVEGVVVRLVDRSKPSERSGAAVDERRLKREALPTDLSRRTWRDRSWRACPRGCRASRPRRAASRAHRRKGAGEPARRQTALRAQRDVAHPLERDRTLLGTRPVMVTASPRVTARSRGQRHRQSHRQHDGALHASRLRSAA